VIVSILKMELTFQIHKAYFPLSKSSCVGQGKMEEISKQRRGLVVTDS